jgi:hypothetical protein
MPLILGANSLTGGYEIDNSCRFNDGSSDYLNRTPGSASNRKTWTFSAWFKLSSGGGNTIFSSYTDANNWTDFYFSGTNNFEFISYASAYLFHFTSSQRFRDYSAWYHIVLTLDTTQATASNRIKLYVNGSQVTALDNNDYPTQNSDHKINSTDPHTLGLSETNTAISYDGYMSEINFIDGQALTPTDFAEFDADSGIWKPIAYEGTYGTNGFYLEFKDSSALGDDTSGEGNNFTVNNLTSIDQTTDTPTNNFATMNPLQNLPSLNTYSEGNNTVTYTVNNDLAEATFGVTTGKWYWEQKYINATGGNAMIGVGNEQAYLSGYLGQNTTGWSYYAPSGGKYHNASTSAYGDSYTTNDIIGIAFDADTRTIWFSKNGVWQNSATIAEISSGTTTNSAYTSMGSAGDLFLPVTSGYNGNVISFNFGNAPYTITTGNADANGYGNFEYAVPSGYYALNTKNLAEFG